MKIADSDDDGGEEMKGISDDVGEEKRGSTEEVEMKRVGLEDETGFTENEDKMSLIPSSDVNRNGVVREYEVALKHLGFGFFHILLLFISGVALSCKDLEPYSISFILPVLSREWGIAKEAILGSTMFMGMLVGSFVWGNLADKIGRRTTVILSLLINAIFGFFSAFLPWFWIFVIFRFFSGFGAGGVFPIPYVSEFIRNKYRGPYLGSHVFFSMIAQMTCAGFAWATIPIGHFDLFGYKLDSWRVYIAICALPSFIGAVMYFFLPESPRFLLQVGKHKKALKILRLAYRLNHLRKDIEYPVKFIELDGTSKLGKCSWRIAGVYCKEVFLRNIDLFQLKFLRQTVLLLIITFCLSFGRYGIILWYPSYINQLVVNKRDVYDFQMFCNKTTSFSSMDKTVSYYCCSSSVFQDTTFNLPELKKWKIDDVLLRNDTFLNVNFDSVLFNSIRFKECKFQNSTFISLFFNATNFNDVQFLSVNILPTSLCHKSEGAVPLENITINSKIVESGNFKLWTILEPEVNLTCSDNGDNQYTNFKFKSDDFLVYRDSFIIAASVLPVKIASAIAVFFFRRNYLLVFFMFASAVSVFLLYLVISETYVVAMLSLFNAVSSPCSDIFNLITVELYPTHLRNTAAGLHRSMARMGAISGINIFGLFVKVNPSIPILLIASLFLVGAVCSLGVPKTTRKTLLK